MSVDLRFVVRRTVGVLAVLLGPALSAGGLAVLSGCDFGYAAGVVVAFEAGGVLLCLATFGLLGVLVWAFSE